MLNHSSKNRFTDKYVKTKTCWNWIATKTPLGYGNFWFRGRIDKAYRVSLIISGIEIPKHLEVNHKCYNPSCVNPDHLELVTHRQNMLDSKTSVSAVNSRKKVCSNCGGRYKIIPKKRICPKCRSVNSVKCRQRNPEKYREYMNDYNRRRKKERLSQRS